MLCQTFQKHLNLPPTGKSRDCSSNSEISSNVGKVSLRDSTSISERYFGWLLPVWTGLLRLGTTARTATSLRPSPLWLGLAWGGGSGALPLLRLA